MTPAAPRSPLPPGPPAARRGSRDLRERVQAWPWRWILAVLVASLVALVALRRPLADRIWPQSRSDGLHAAAEVALSEGRLAAADGTGARELFEAARALDPDDLAAQDGLARVARAAVAQARAAVERGDHAAAHRAIALARALDAPRTDVSDVAEALRIREVQGADIDALLRRAADARATGDLDGSPGSALPLYARVLALQPDHTGALAGREDAVADLLEDARLASRLGRVAEAADLVRRARGFDAAHPDLPDAQAALAAAAERRRGDADAALDAGRLETALQGYREVLFADPDDGRAITGLAAVAATWAGRASRLAADFRFAPAMEALEKARSIDPTAPEIARASADLQQARAAHARLRPTSEPSDAAGRARLDQVLAGIDRAAERGEWLAPPGDSAFDRLRTARTLAPGDPRVAEAATRLLAMARECFDDGLRGNRLGRAGECLSLRSELGDAASTLAADRRELAMRWIAFGDERLGAGELDNARRALDRAQALDPDAMGLRAFADRVSTATAARD
jgi:tetratricopeptide (TPR) repeat protein